MKKILLTLLLFIPFFSYEQTSSQSPSYVITFQTPNYIATPVAGSSLSSYSGTDAYTVIQNAITALTPSAGGSNSAGGWIQIAISTISGIAFQFQPTTNTSGNFNISFDYRTN